MQKRDIVQVKWPDHETIPIILLDIHIKLLVEWMPISFAVRIEPVIPLLIIMVDCITSKTGCKKSGVILSCGTIIILAYLCHYVV
jgi:hypothetical protein